VRPSGSRFFGPQHYLQAGTTSALPLHDH